MSYQHLDIPDATPPTVRNFVRNHIDMQFADVHNMLRLPILELGLHAGCNFAAANSLLSIASGCAALLAPQANTTGKAWKTFRDTMSRFYPWDAQPPVSGDVATTIEHLYKYVRNPLSHSFGLRSKGNYMVMIAKESMSESEIERLELSATPRSQAFEYQPVDGDEDLKRFIVYVDNLYWGSRQMLIRICADPVEARKVEATLDSLGIR